MGDTRAIDSLKRGIETAKSGNKLLARLHLLQAVELAPNDPNCWLWLAWVAESPASAIHSLQRVLDVDPDHELAQLGMQWAKAMADFDYQASSEFQEDIAEGEPSPAEDAEGFSALEGYADRGAEGEPRDAEDDEPIAWGESESSIPLAEEAGTDDDGEPFADEKEDPANPELTAGDEELEISSEPAERKMAEWFANDEEDAETAEADGQEEPSAFAENSTAEFGESDESPWDAEVAETNEERSRWEEHNAFEDGRDEEEDSASAWGEPVEETHQDESRFENSDAAVSEDAANGDDSAEGFWNRPGAEEDLADTVPMRDAADAEAESEIEPAVEAQTEIFEEESPPEETIAESPAAPIQASESGVSVLVVDDSPTVRKLVSMTLEKNGYTVAAAADGVVALKSIAELKPQLILLDITMPRLGGYQLCKLIKKHESTKHIPVIMLSGKDGMFDKVRGKFVGCDDYITKPFDPDLLIEKVSAQLTEHYGVAATQS